MTLGETESYQSSIATHWGLLPLCRSGHITGRQNYQRQDGCRCDFATDIIAVEGMSGSPVISSDGEVLGILTLAGNGKFRGLSFGVSFEEAKSFSAAEGVIVSGRIRGSRAIERNWAASSSAKPGGREAHDTFVPFAFSPLGNHNP